MKIPCLLFVGLASLLPLYAYDNDCGNPAQNDPGCEDGKNVGTNPINPHRACLLREVTDLQTFGAAPIAFTRHYNSRTRDYTKPRWELGTQYTWQHNWQYEVRESATSDFGFPRLIVRYPEGREYYFQAVDATGAVRVPDASCGDRLYPTGAGTYTLRTPEGREYDFHKVGSGNNYQYLLDQVRNGTGWKWILTYQTQADGKQRLYRITNNYGRYLQLNRVAGANGYYQLTSVIANDGRSVSYGYSTWAPTNETVLVSVTYPDATAAAYTWCGAESVNSGPPLLASANDPMQSTSGSRMKYIYNYTAAYFAGSPNGIVNGTILEERSLVTDKVVVSLPLGSGSYPQVLEGNGTELGRKYENGLIKETADGEGRTTVYTRSAGGAGYIIGIQENNGAQTTFTRDYAGRVLTRTNALGGVRTFTYNPSGFLLTETDELNRTTTHTRDASNRITKTTYPDSSSEEFTYTGTGLVKTHRLRNGFTESFTYDGWGNLATHVDAAGYLWTYTSTASGLRESVKDPRNFTTSYQYNWRGLLTKVTHPDNTTQETTYTPYGKRQSAKDELGHTWTYTYTEYNQLKTATDPLNRTTSYEYGAEPGCGTCGYLPTLSKITLPSGKTIEQHYDKSGKLTSRVVAPGTPDEAVTAYTYDAKGRVETLTDPRGKITSYTYDLLDRRKTLTDPLNHTTSWDYDAVGNVLTTTRADGSVITNTYDAMDRILTTKNPKNETTTYTYHPDGNLTSLKDARGSQYTFTVDPLSRRTRMIYPGGSYEKWTYDGAGNLTIYRARNAATKTCTYDNRDRDTLCDWSDTTPDTSKTYDAVSRLLTLVNSTLTLTYTYDAANQLLSETYGFGGTFGNKVVVYTYDLDGNRQTLAYPDGSVVEYGYTARNQVATITADGPPPLATFTYDPAGNRLTKTLENGVTATSVYDDANRLTSLTHAKGAVNLAVLDYTYDLLNRRTNEQLDANGGDNFTYDAADQLAYVDYASGNNVSYAYDAAGNRTQVDDSASGSVAYASANALNQYSTFGANGTAAYDANGNLSGLTNGMQSWTFAYDSANRLIGNNGGPIIFTFRYDARNRVIKRLLDGVITYQIYDEWNLIAEYNANGTLLAKYIHGPNTDELLAKIDNNGSVYYHENALGSTIALTDAVGSVVERYAYDVYGKPTFKDGGGNKIPASAYGNRFLFTGREWLAKLSLYDYRNRVYSPELGRFLQIDPIRFAAQDVNLYRYVSNNSVNQVDSLGFWEEKPDSIQITGLWTSTGVEYEWQKASGEGHTIADAIFANYAATAQVTCVCDGEEKIATGTRIAKRDLQLGPFGPIRTSPDSSPVNAPAPSSIFSGIGEILGALGGKAIPITPLPTEDQKKAIENAVKDNLPGQDDIGDGWLGGKSPCE